MFDLFEAFSSAVAQAHAASDDFLYNRYEAALIHQCRGNIQDSNQVGRRDCVCNGLNPANGLVDDLPEPAKLCYTLGL